MQCPIKPRGHGRFRRVNHDHGLWHTVLSAGASTGIGYHAAVSLAQKGYVVYAGVRKSADVDKLQQLGVASLRPIILDVTQPDTIDASVQTIQQQLAAEDLPFVALVNNAGIAVDAPVELLDLDKARPLSRPDVYEWPNPSLPPPALAPPLPPPLPWLR